MNIIAQIEEYINLLKETDRILRGFRIVYEFKPPILRLNRQIIPPGDLDLATGLDPNVKIVGEKKMRIRTIEEAILYLAAVQTVLIQYQHSKGQELEHTTTIRLAIIPATLLLKAKYPEAIIKITLNAKGLTALKTIVCTS